MGARSCRTSGGCAASTGTAECSRIRRRSSRHGSAAANTQRRSIGRRASAERASASAPPPLSLSLPLLCSRFTRRPLTRRLAVLRLPSPALRLSDRRCGRVAHEAVQAGHVDVGRRGGCGHHRRAGDRSVRHRRGAGTRQPHRVQRRRPRPPLSGAADDRAERSGERQTHEREARGRGATHGQRERWCAMIIYADRVDERWSVVTMSDDVLDS